MIRRLLSPLAALFALTLWAASAHADDLTAVVDRYVAWRGGDAFERLHSIHETGRLDAAGLKGSIEIWEDRGGSSRVDFDLGVVKQATGISRSGNWSTTESGQVIEASEAAVKSARRTLALDFGDAIRGRDGAQVTLKGGETRDGRTFTVVRVSFGDADSWELFLDPATGALYGQRVVEDRRARFERFDDWRTVAGVRMPYAVSVRAETPDGDQEVRLDRIDLDATIDQARFAKPDNVRKAAFARGARSTDWMTFEFFDGLRIFIPGKVQGHEVPVVLDSGTSVTVLDKAFADRIGAKAEGQVTANGTGGTETAGMIKGVTIQLGDLTLPDLTVVAFDIAPIGKRIGHPLPVILGNEIFNQVIVDIDFKARRIAFHEPEGFRPPAGAIEVPIRLADALRAVPVSLEGRAPSAFDFDLGNGSPLIVFPGYAQAQKLLDGRPTSKVLGGGAGGVRPETVTTIRRVRFAGVTFTDVPASIPPTGASAVDTALAQGNIGMPILSRFHLITDFPHQRVWVVPYADTATAPFSKDRLGVSLNKDGKAFVVEYVSPGGPAEAAGLKAGDRIALIDRKSPEAWPDAALRALRYRPAGTAVVLTMASGRTRRIKLAGFY